jgi:hypothetical protein
MSDLLKEELMLRIDQELRYQMDHVIQQMSAKARDFRIGVVTKERSPLRNILLVASDPTASLEVIKTYIRYQTGRKEGSDVWRQTHNNQRFADVVIGQLEGLKKTAEQIFEEIQQSVSDKHPLRNYSQQPGYLKDLQDLHLRLVRLYLGSLVREHTALVEENKDKDASKAGARNKQRNLRPPENRGNSVNPATQRPKSKR